MVLRPQLPVLGNGAGVWSFIYIDDAAHATQLAIEHETPGLYNVVGDEAAEVVVWLSELARALASCGCLARTIGDWRDRAIHDDHNKRLIKFESDA
jgi:nucleoside-diphosphate-sugar epimerase